MASSGTNFFQIEVPGLGGETISSQHGDPVYNSSLVELGKKLLSAAKDGDTEEVRLLMSRGAPFTTDWLGTSPLHLTAKYDRLETSEVLLRAGCSRDARTKVEKTPLHVAAQEGHPDVCELLLLHGADVDARDMLRMTPLHWAVERGCCGTVEALLKHGANPNIESKFDKTPLEIASENGRPDIFEILQNADNLRMDPIDCGDGIESGSNGNMLISQQEVVSTGHFLGHNIGVHFGQKKTLHINKSLQLIKTENSGSIMEGNNQPLPLQVSLDPVQIALNSAGAGDLGDLSEMTGNDDQDEALKLLASHGITMLPENDPPAPTLALTDAGKLALGKVNSPKILRVSNPKTLTPISATRNPGSFPRITKIVTLGSSSSNPQSVSLTGTPVSGVNTTNNKPIRVFKLTPAQAEALKKSRVTTVSKDKVILSSQGPDDPNEDIKSEVNKENGKIMNLDDGDDSLSEPGEKFIKLNDGLPKSVTEDKAEQKRKLLLQLQKQEEERERLKEEQRLKELECEKIKAQLEALE